MSFKEMGGELLIRSPTNKYNYYFNMLLSRCVNMFKFNGLPATVNEQYFNIALMTAGQCSITKINNEYYAILGYRGGQPNTYYLPNSYIIANPYLNVSENIGITDKRLTVFYNSSVDEIVPTANGLAGLITTTAQQLTSIDVSIEKALENTRLTAFITVENDNQKKSCEMALKKMQQGEDVTAVSGDVYGDIKISPLANSEISKYFQSFIETRQYILANFYHSLGVNSNYNLKRAQLSSDEIKTNDDVLIINTVDMLQERKKCVKEFNEKTGLNITVDFSDEWKNLKKIQEGSTNSLDTQTNMETGGDNNVPNGQ